MKTAKKAASEQFVNCTLKIHSAEGDPIQFPQQATLDEQDTHVVILRMVTNSGELVATVAMRRGEFSLLCASPNSALGIQAALITEQA